MINNRLQVGLVGLGTWARGGHLPVYTGPRMKKIMDLKALCSRDINKANSWAKEFGVQGAYTDIDEMLAKEALDVVVVCTPDSLHTSYIEKALNCKAHVIVEKPLATTINDCSTILNLALEVDRQVIVLFHKRADPLWLQARRQVLAGNYGPLQIGFASIFNPVFVPAGGYFQSKMTNYTNPNWFLGTHFYDLLCFITGIRPIHVRATQYYGRLQELGLDVIDSLKADFIFSDKSSISVCSGWNLPAEKPTLTKQSMHFHFQNGELELDGTQRGFTEYSANGVSYMNPYFLSETEAGLQGYGAQFLEDAMLTLYDSNHKPVAPLPSYEDLWYSTAMAEAAEVSADKEKTVQISTPGWQKF